MSSLSAHVGCAVDRTIGMSPLGGGSGNFGGTKTRSHIFDPACGLDDGVVGKGDTDAVRLARRTESRIGRAWSMFPVLA